LRIPLFIYKNQTHFFNALTIPADNTGVMLKNLIKQQMERRQYIRHPAEISVEYAISGEQEKTTDLTQDISFGGIRFRGRSYIEPGTVLSLKFPTIHAGYEVSGRVVWSKQKKDHVEMGVEFLDENEAYRAQLIEEICHLKSKQQEEFEAKG
jgi:c-di-GMP-binding flagellar brake protein YcgR